MNLTNNDLQFRFEEAIQTRYAERTRKAYEQDLWNFFNYFKREAILSLTSEQIKAFLTHQLNLKDEDGDPKFSPRSVNRLRASITSFYDYAMEQQWTNNNPARKVESIKVNEENTDYLTEREIMAILCLIETSTRKDKYVAARDHLMIRLSLHCGLTTYEILNLTFEQVDFKTNQLTITDVNEVERSIPLPLVLEEEYEAYLKLRQAIQTENHLVFTSQFGEPIKAQSYSNALKKYAKKIRMFKKMSQSVFRHTYARQKIFEGMTSRELSRRLGHSNHYYTERLYQTWFQEANDPTTTRTIY